MGKDSTQGVKEIPYWLDTIPAFPDRSGRPLPDDVDVAIVGGGITGLSAAIRLARKGAAVVILEQDRFGSGASGRNGGMCTTGVPIDLQAAVERYGLAAARAYHDAYREAVDFVERVVTEEGIDCDFRRAGRLGMAFRASHHERQRATHKLLAEQFGHETFLIGRDHGRSPGRQSLAPAHAQGIPTLRRQGVVLAGCRSLLPPQGSVCAIIAQVDKGCTRESVSYS